MSTELRAAIEAESRAERIFRQFIRNNAAELLPIAHWGDGECGFLKDVACEELGIRKGVLRTIKKKAKISRSLAKRVFERDAYRCVSCGSFIDLTCDHIVPESKGGATTFENLQAMCRACNCKKGAR